MLRLDEATHTYYWNKTVVPGVTRVIAHLTDYSHVPPGRLLTLQDEGRAIHKMVEMDANGVEQDIPQWLTGRYAALQRFKAETGAECWCPERRMYHANLGYAGTADWFGVLPNLPSTKGPICLDVKRSLYGGPAIGLQTQAYLEMWNDLEGKSLHIVNRGALVLNDDGTYRVKVYADPEDRAAFLACLQQYRWRERHYGKPD